MNENVWMNGNRMNSSLYVHIAFYGLLRTNLLVMRTIFYLEGSDLKVVQGILKIKRSVLNILRAI
jgi:hypothetical protein